MGIINVFKTIGCGFKEIGKGVIKVVDVADDVVDHPAVAPGLMVLSMITPIKYVQFGVKAIKEVNTFVKKKEKEYNEIISDEDKRALFAEKFKKEFPDASNGDISSLSALLVKLNKKEEETNGDS